MRRQITPRRRERGLAAGRNANDLRRPDRGLGERDWGRVTAMKVPGAGLVQLYEPRHASPLHAAAK